MVMHHTATRWRQRAAQTPTLESSICPHFRKTSRELVLCTSRTALQKLGFCSGPFRMPTPSIYFQHSRETQGSEAFSCRSPGQHPALSGCLSDPLTCLPCRALPLSLSCHPPARRPALWWPPSAPVGMAWDSFLQRCRATSPGLEPLRTSTHFQETTLCCLLDHSVTISCSHHFCWLHQHLPCCRFGSN